jgi:hypothetical protein
MRRKKPIQFPPGYLGEASRAEAKPDTRCTRKRVLSGDHAFLDAQWLTQPKCCACEGDGCRNCLGYGVAVN